MSKTRERENRLAEEVKSIGRDNPNVDLELFQEWLEIKTVLDKIPADAGTEQAEVQPPRLQPIPLKMFSRK